MAKIGTAGDYAVGVRALAQITDDLVRNVHDPHLRDVSVIRLALLCDRLVGDAPVQRFAPQPGEAAPDAEQPALLRHAVTAANVAAVALAANGVVESDRPEARALLAKAVQSATAAAAGMRDGFPVSPQRMAPADGPASIQSPERSLCDEASITLDAITEATARAMGASTSALWNRAPEGLQQAWDFAARRATAGPVTKRLVAAGARAVLKAIDCLQWMLRDSHVDAQQTADRLIGRLSGPAPVNAVIGWLIGVEDALAAVRLSLAGATGDLGQCGAAGQALRELRAQHANLAKKVGYVGEAFAVFGLGALAMPSLSPVVLLGHLLVAAVALQIGAEHVDGGLGFGWVTGVVSLVREGAR